MKNPSKFDKFDYTIQHGVPDVLKDSWFAINHNYRLVAVGATEKEAADWLEVQSLVLENSRGVAIAHYEEELREGTERDALLEVLKATH